MKKSQPDRRAFLRSTAAASLALGAPFLMTRAAHGKADMMGASAQKFHRVKLGGFEVTTLLDNSRPVPGPENIFGTNQKPEDVAALLSANNLPTGASQFYFTPVLVNTGAQLVLFDTGLGQDNTLATAIEAAGYSTDQIDTVVITHMHGDHIGGVSADGKPTFANAKHIAGETEMNFWTSDKVSEEQAKAVNGKIVPIRDRFDLIKPGQDVVSGITAIEAYGHTPGHMAYNIESDGKRMILAADAANHFVLSLQQPDWEVKFDMDKSAAAATRKKLFGMAAADGVPFTGYHMPFPAIGYVETMGPGFRYVAETYQLDL